MKVVISAAARADIRQIGLWIARSNPVRSLTFVAELRSACLGLATLTERFQLVPRYEKRGIRRRVHGNYLILYEVDPVHVRVVRVIHGATDYRHLLGDSSHS
ncbi:type II toxin-antitoxin system RelE/ParE family toxin [Mesorhizobium sp. YIM 152430]|uniref:type II toxin-antitoxin system RelE/ParE family toxin n=1 Tax=Mesorhizobium sp. YIM 152430 TaxID=3031761 RepID=UPI0023DBE9B3|nr:type II toxin-antitoxin system RelE/ParE family toxin [Mesorhizobium sp. YIM 152430]MDF1601014.1 type II toxin-antitoxin system RelE/ParE family toxin [Mesorhizobium sp. YIM 152430]